MGKETTMSDLVDKLKKQQAEQAAKRQTNSPVVNKAGTTPTVDNKTDDDAILGAKQGKSGGQAIKSALAGAGSTTKAEATPPPTPEPTEYKVVSGDNLSAIAQKHYGDANRWRDIYEANKETIGANPSAIRVGMVLKIPR
jgi:nucleoid-associated protein YgaU